MAAIPILMECLCDAFKYFGFRINWGPGKTECFLSLRGRNAAAVRREVEAAGHCIKLPRIPDVPGLRVVTMYKHLGSYLDESGSNAADAPHRVSSSMSAYAPLARKIFGALAISRSVRLYLFNSLVISRLVYNVHVWTTISRQMYAQLNSPKIDHF